MTDFKVGDHVRCTQPRFECFGRYGVITEGIPWRAAVGDDTMLFMVELDVIKGQDNGMVDLLTSEMEKV